jgi:hypothetical protein
LFLRAKSRSAENEHPNTRKKTDDAEKHMNAKITVENYEGARIGFDRAFATVKKSRTNCEPPKQKRRTEET